MDKFLRHHATLVAKAVNTIEQGLHDLKDNIMVLLGYFDNGFENPQKHCYTTPNLNNQSNEFDNQSTPTKSHQQILKELEEMIVELKIKGSVRERPDGRFEYRSALLGSIYGKTKEEIEQKITQKLKEVKRNKGKPIGKKKEIPLLSEFFITQYLPYKKNQKCSENTIKGYHNSFSYIRRENFDKPLNDYKPNEIEDFLYSIPHSRTRQILQGFLNNMFDRAIVLNLIKFNPCSAIEKVQHKQEQGTAFSFDEQAEFFDRLSRSDALTYAEKCYFLFVYLTGTRKNEALGVTVEDVDFKNKVLSIRGTKTIGSNRQVPLTPLVENLLLSLYVDSGAYFPINGHKVEKLYNKVRNHHKLHDLRHTYGTIQVCVEEIDVKTVSLIMGHSTVNTTLAIYTHPEQLDRGIFLRGDLSADEKLAIYQNKYQKIICQISNTIKLTI